MLLQMIFESLDLTNKTKEQLTQMRNDIGKIPDAELTLANHQQYDAIITELNNRKKQSYKDDVVTK